MNEKISNSQNFDVQIASTNKIQTIIKVSEKMNSKEIFSSFGKNSNNLKYVLTSNLLLMNANCNANK